MLVGCSAIHYANVPKNIVVRGVAVIRVSPEVLSSSNGENAPHGHRTWLSNALPGIEVTRNTLGCGMQRPRFHQTSSDETSVLRRYVPDCPGTVDRVL